jgi:hypothetical protein
MHNFSFWGTSKSWTAKSLDCTQTLDAFCH